MRSPGSALKPFIYGLGFEDGLIHPESLIEDRPIRYAGYAPENFDLTFQGTVTVRRALQLSLNVPAVAVLDEVGPSRLIARLAEAGAPLVLPRSEAPGLALGLGGVGVRLTDLTMLYAGLARQGTVAPLIERLGAPPLPPRRLIEPVAAWYVGNVLLGTPPPENAAGGRIAFKTGTSYGYRDAWAIGFDGKRTIGVWTGRPDGAPVAGLVGRISAAPILFDAFARMGQGYQPLPPMPKGAIIASTAKLPPPLQRFAPGESAGEAMAPKVHIVFPPNGASLELAGVDRREAGPDRHQDRGRHPSPQRADERHAARRQEIGADAVLRARRPGLRAAHRDRRDRRGRQRRGAAAIDAVCRYFFLATCSGLPLRLVEANSSSCFSLIDSYMLLDAPLSSLTGVSPRLAASAAPAAFCCAADFAGIVASPCWTSIS